MYGTVSWCGKQMENEKLKNVYAVHIAPSVHTFSIKLKNKGDKKCKP